MENRILGIHHITAIAGNAQRNYDFYTKALGLRLVKKTVNFDDSGTYHFYFGDEVGSPGSILTFFPWERVKQGRRGTGMATEIAYSVPAGSLEFWSGRFDSLGIKYTRGKRFEEEFISFEDPDGLLLLLIAADVDDERKCWITEDIKGSEAIRGFYSVSLNLNNVTATAEILTDIFGYKLREQEGNRYRYITDAVENANIVDLIETPDGEPGINAGGTNHHVAFRVKDDTVLMEYRKKIESRGLNITPKIDRDYFFSLYFREPGGVLFELATDTPGFLTDESIEDLGSSLKLPKRYEAERTKIESHLPQLNQY